MHQVVRVAFAALVAGVFLNIAGLAAAQPLGLPPAVKQIQLTEKHIEGFIAAQKDMGPILENSGAASDQLPANIRPRWRRRQEERFQGFRRVWRSSAASPW